MENENGEVINDPIRVADLLQNQYTSVYSNPLPEKKIIAPSQFFRIDQTNEEDITDVAFTEEDIKEAINEIKHNSAAEPDNIPAIFLKNCKDSISKPLYILWRRSLDTGTIPASLTEEKVVPIFKEGSRALPKNYRPVTLTSHIMKIFERILRKNLISHLETKNHLNTGPTWIQERAVLSLPAPRPLLQCLRRGEKQNKCRCHIPRFR